MDYRNFQCPFPYVIPESLANQSLFTLGDCTEVIANVLDPSILIYQIIFTLLWLFVFSVHLHNLIKLKRAGFLKPIQYYRFQVAAVGSIQAFLEILFWIVHQNIVEFWGALAKVQVKLFVTRQGIPLLEKYGLLFVCGLSTIVFGAIEYFGPSQYCNLFSAIKYLVFAISVFGLSIRAAFFVRTIDRGILSLSGPETEGAGTGVNRSSLVWQLRFKFFVFFAVAISFSGYSLERAIYKFQRSWKCTPRTCNRKYVYNFPIPQVLYLIAAFAILLQFTNIAYCSSKTSFGSKSRSGSGNNQIPQQHEVKSTQIGLSDRVNQNLSLKKSYPSITNMSDIVAVKPN